jgi:phage tail protein X
MSTVTEIEAAIEQLAPEAQRELADWLNSRLIKETPAMLAAIDEADHSLAAEGGVPVEDVRRNLRQWITG